MARGSQGAWRVEQGAEAEGRGQKSEVRGIDVSDVSCERRLRVVTLAAPSRSNLKETSALYETETLALFLVISDLWPLASGLRSLCGSGEPLQQPSQLFVGVEVDHDGALASLGPDLHFGAEGPLEILLKRL